MNFDISKVPFSCFGSYYAISRVGVWEDEEEGIYLRTLYQDASRKRVFKLELASGGLPVPFIETATPTVLRLEGEIVGKKGYAEICFNDPSCLMYRVKNLSLKLSFIHPTYTLQAESGRWEINCAMQKEKIMLTELKGKITPDPSRQIRKGCSGALYLTPEAGNSHDDCFGEGVIELYRQSSVWKPRKYPGCFREGYDNIKSKFDRWMASAPKVHEEYAEAMELAQYLNWSAVVSPEGNLTRNTMYASKNWMNGIWSWDHCYNAMATVLSDPELAWDQMMVIMDNQDEFGAFPDVVRESTAIWNFSKPPIHGWALDWMMKHTDFITKEMLHQIYKPLCKWTEWWFTYRDADGDGIPQYHDGNDSGWDNSTVFSEGIPVESPDLSAFLVLQMEVLSEVAEILGDADGSEMWKNRSVELLDKMLRHFVKDNRFTAVHSGTHEIIESKSLLLYIPIILGKRLPDDILTTLTAHLKEDGRFLTEHGLASEELTSPLFDIDGYWRGPIWAPPTLLICHGLREMGEKEFSKALAARFCDMVAAHGMAENFNALTGEPLRDPTITWTSCIFTLLATEYI